MGDEIIIPDISYWQGRPYSESPNDSGIDYDKLAAMSPHGVILRASRGSYKDLRFEQNYAELTARGVPLAAYHFFVPVVSIEDQLDAWRSAVTNKYFGLPYFGYVLDVEAPASGWSKIYYSLQVEEMVAGMEAEAIYTRASFWDDNVLASTADGLKLWVAHYGTFTPAIPNGWTDYALHQYSADGNGMGAAYGVLSSAIDLNRVNPAYVPPPTPDPGEPDCEPRPVLVCQVPALNIRSGPGISYTDVGDLEGGAAVEVYELAVNGPSSIWAKIEPDSDRWCAVLYGNAVYLK